MLPNLPLSRPQPAGAGFNLPITMGAPGGGGGGGAGGAKLASGECVV